MLTHRLPWPPSRGTTIRSYHILKYLSSQHEIALLSFVQSKTQLEEYLKHLRTLCGQVETIFQNDLTAKLKAASALFNGTPLSVKAFHSKEFLNHCDRLMQDFKPDLVFTDSSALAAYPMKLNQPFVADFMDVDSEKWNQFSKYSSWPINWIYNKEAKRLAQFEKKVSECAERVLVVSEQEKDQMSSLSPNAHIEVIPNGVDRDYFKPQGRSVIPGRVVFTGVMDYLPNVDGVEWFCREIWPLVRQQVPNASFFIVGSDPSLKVRSLAHLPGVFVTGKVPDVRPYIEEAEVCVAPLRFAIGLQNKVLEALSMGKATVATSGAVQGLNGSKDKVLKIADNAVTFTNSMVDLLKASNRRKEYETAGPIFVEQYYDWGRNLKALNTVCNINTHN